MSLQSQQFSLQQHTGFSITAFTQLDWESLPLSLQQQTELLEGEIRACSSGWQTGSPGPSGEKVAQQSNREESLGETAPSWHEEGIRVEWKSASEEDWQTDTWGKRATLRPSGMCHFKKEVREHLVLEIRPGARGFPAVRGLGLLLSVQGMQVQTLVRALRSHMLQGPKSQNTEQKHCCYRFIKA